MLRSSNHTVITDGCSPWWLRVTNIRVVGCKSSWQNKKTSLKRVWLPSLTIYFTLPNRLFMPPSNKWGVSSAEYGLHLPDPTYFCFQLCLRHMQEDALPAWFSTSLFIFPLSLGCLMVQQTQSFFNPWIVTLLKYLF